MKEPVFLDIETAGDPWDGKLLILGYCVGGDDFLYLTHDDFEEESRDALAFLDLLDDPERPVVEHTKYDVRWLKLAGFIPMPSGPIYDTQVMAWVINENTPLDLESLVFRYTGQTMDKRLTRSENAVWFRTDTGGRVPLEEAPFIQLFRYNADDVVKLRDLYYALRESLEAQMWDDFWLEEEVPFTKVLVDMECAGLPIDLEAALELRDRLEDERALLERELLDEADLPDGFNIMSGDQLAAYLFGKVVTVKTRIRWTPDEIACLKSCLAGEHEDCWIDLSYEGPDEGLGPTGVPYVRHIWELLPSGFSLDHVGRDYVTGHYTVPGKGLKSTKMTPSGKRKAVDSKLLLVKFGEDSWIQRLIRMRKLDKAVGTYLRAFPRFTHEGRLHGKFNQTGTVTGRLSSSEPNLQNIPAHGDLGPAVRELFRGDLVVGDYSQLEPRLMAHFSGDAVLLDAYTTGKDVYIITAEGIFGYPVGHDDDERQIAKTVFLGTQYGAQAPRLAEILSINGFPTPVDRAAEYLRELSKLYHELFAWKDRVIQEAHIKGYVKTLAGRHRRLKRTLKDFNWKTMSYGERQAVNAKIQGSAADIVRRVMVQQADLFEHSLQLLGQVHDELIWETTGGRYPGGPDGLLRDVQAMGEQLHGFDLRVPLVFEPSYCKTWAEKGGGGLLLPEDLEDDEDAA